MARMVALLRAVNVGGRKLPMAELRAHVRGARLGRCRDLYPERQRRLRRRRQARPTLEAALEAAIAKRFRLRGAGDRPHRRRNGRDYPPANPFPEAARDEPNIC